MESSQSTLFADLILEIAEPRGSMFVLFAFQWREFGNFAV